MYSDDFLQILKSRNMLTVEQLSKLPTPRLLKYFKTHRIFPIRYYRFEPEKRDVYDEYNDYINEIKAMLNTREHVED